MSEASTTLSNVDFQQFVAATPRPEFDDDDDLFDIPTSKRKRRLTKFKHPNKKSKSRVKWEEKKKEKKVVYRDRSKEMRDGVTSEYTGDRDPEHYDAETRQRSAYLGGDIEHTHLVEGLDRVLLKQRRDELEVEESIDIEKSRKDVKAEEQRLITQKEQMKFKTNVGRRVHYLLFPSEIKVQSRRRKLETFLPGRMVYEFDLDPRDVENIPTTITRSSEDCPQFEDLIPAKLENSLLLDIKKIFHTYRTGRRAQIKRSQKSHNESTSSKDKSFSSLKSVSKHKTSSAKGADDDDIFEGLGSYVFQPKIEKPLSRTKLGAFGDGKLSSRDAHHRTSHQKSHGPQMHQSRMDRVDSYRNSDSISRNDRERNSGKRHTDDRTHDTNRTERWRNDDRSRPSQQATDKKPRDSSPPGKLRSILRKKPVSAVQLAEETAANLARRNNMNISDRVNLEREDPFNLEAFYDKEAKKFRVKSHVRMGLVSREVADPYDTYSSAVAGILMDDDSDNEENLASRKRKRLQNPPSKAAQLRMEKRRLDKQLHDVNSVMKNLRRGL